MTEGKISVEQFDEWLRDDSNIAALVLRQQLESVEGENAVVFPPTYAKPDGVSDKEWSGYNIDRFEDGSNVCTIDSVGSQANRMEPIFKQNRYKCLVPQVVIKADDHLVHLLDAGHRAADAIARFAGQPKGGEGPPLAQKLWDGFKAWQKNGNAEPLARLAPTSLVFGAWDSRGTQAKIPRIVRAVIRAHNVNVCTRSAQFNTPLHYVEEGLIDEKVGKNGGNKNLLSQEGFRHNPATGAHGGVIAKGGICRDACLNLVALRTLGTGAKDENHKKLFQLRRYILGLAMVAITSRNERQFNLREGCLLRIAESSSWEKIPFEGEKQDLVIDAENAFTYAKKAAEGFGVEQMDTPYVFDKKMASKWLSSNPETRKKEGRKSPRVN